MGWGGAGAGVLGAARGAGAERGPWGRRDDRLPPPAGASWKGSAARPGPWGLGVLADPGRPAGFG